MLTISDSPESHKDYDLVKNWPSLAKKSANKVAIHFHISQLAPYNRQPHQVHQAFKDLKRIFSPLNGSAYYLQNNDFVCILPNISPIFIERSITQFKRLLNNGAHITNNFKRETLYTLYNLGWELGKFEDAIFNIANTLPSKSLVEVSDDLDINHFLILDGLKLDTLILIEKILHQADISAFLRRQVVTWYEKSHPLQIMGTHFYFSTKIIQEALKINADLDGNIWLFRQLTTCLDKHMIKKLPELLAQKSSNNIQLNINLRTIVTLPFQNFIKAYVPNPTKRLSFMFNILDVIAHPDAMSYGYSILNDKNILVGINGIKASHLDCIVLENIKTDIYKISWSPTLFDKIEVVKDLIKKVGSERIILHEADSEGSFDFGEKVGIHLYQGRAIDALLKKKV